MKLRSIIGSFALVAASIAGVGLFAQPPAGGPGGPGGGPQAPKTELAKHMGAINELYGTNGLKAQITDPSKNADSIKKLEEIKGHFQETIKLMPAYLAQQPEENKKKFMDDFNAQQQKELDTIDKLIAALKANNAADIATLYKAMDDIHLESHMEFRAPRGRGGRGPGGPGGPGGAAAPGGGGAPRGN